MTATVRAIDALIPPEAAADLGRRVPAVSVPQDVALAVLRLYARMGMDAKATAAMIDTMAVLVGASGSPERIAAALVAWADRAEELAGAAGSSQIGLTHNVVRGKTGGIRVTTALEF